MSQEGETQNLQEDRNTRYSKNANNSAESALSTA
jgi:hypothetical protein